MRKPGKCFGVEPVGQGIRGLNRGLEDSAMLLFAPFEIPVGTGCAKLSWCGWGNTCALSLSVSCRSRAVAGWLCNEIAEKSCAPGASLPSDQYHDENNQKYYNKNGPPIMAHHFLQFSFPF